MASSDQYAAGSKALSAVIQQFIKENVPSFLQGEVSEYQTKIDQFTQQGSAAVVDAVIPKGP